MHKLVITRGSEDRIKYYTYAAAALTGFDQAIARHSRLASRIVLIEEVQGEIEGPCVNVSDLIVREWNRAPVVTEPEVLYDFTKTGFNVTEMDAILSAVPSVRTTIDGGPWQAAHTEDDENDECEVVPPLTRALLWIDKSGLFRDERLHVLLLPTKFEEDTGLADVGAIITVLYFKRFGRLPLILTGYSSDVSSEKYELIDLNKLVLA